MSKEQPSKRSKRKYQIRPLEITASDVAASRSLVAGLMGKSAREQVTPVESSPAKPSPVDPTPVITSPATSTAPEVGVQEPRTSSPAEKSTPVKSTPVEMSAVRDGLHPTMALPARPRDAMRSHYGKLPNAILDTDVLHQVAPATQIVYLHLLRLSVGHNRDWCKISREGLARRTGYSDKTCAGALRELTAFRMVEKLEHDNESGDKHERGTTYRIFVPVEASECFTPVESSPVENASVKRAPVGSTPERNSVMKERILKETHEMPAADAPADMYEVRRIAARVREVHHGKLGYSAERFRADVRTALIGAGRDAEDDTIDEAIKGMAL